MQDIRISLRDIMSQASEADVTPLRNFLFSNPEKPLVTTGSGGAESVADFAALLYGARGGVGTAVSPPYTLNSYSDAALKTAKLLLVSAGGHNNDITFAAKRALDVNPVESASFTLSQGERNEVRKLFLKASSELSLDIPGTRTHDGFVSTGTPLMFFALLCRAFNPGCELGKYSGMPLNLEGKLTESGLATAMVSDYRNYCHGRFIFTSNHLEDSAVVMLVSPRERDIVERTSKFLPAQTSLVIIETEEDTPEAALDLLVRTTAFFFELCEATGTNHESPSNPGRIDKRVPIWVPFISGMKKNGPLTIR